MPGFVQTVVEMETQKIQSLHGVPKYNPSDAHVKPHTRTHTRETFSFRKVFVQLFMLQWGT